MILKIVSSGEIAYMGQISASLGCCCMHHCVHGMKEAAQDHRFRFRGMSWDARGRQQTELSKGSKPVYHCILGEFRHRECFPNVQRDCIRAKISPCILTQTLGLSRVTIEDLHDTENLRYLELPEDALLKFSHGRPRLEAARRHIYRLLRYGHS